MNVHGIYDTNAYMMTFENKEQYRSHLQTESASAGYGFGFNGGVNKAFGIGLEGSEQVYLAVTNVDIDRWENNADILKQSTPALRTTCYNLHFAIVGMLKQNATHNLQKI